MNSNMVKPEKFDHLHLVFHTTVPLRLKSLESYVAALARGPSNLISTETMAAIQTKALVRFLLAVNLGST